MNGEVVEDGGWYHPFQLYSLVIKSLYLIATWLEINDAYLCTRQLYYSRLSVWSFVLAEIPLIKSWSIYRKPFG